MGSRSLCAPALVLLITMGSYGVAAQDPRVFLGAITKLVVQGENGQAQETQQFLATTEARAAEQFIKATDVEYLDRVSMESLFSELRLSSSSAFDAATGPAPGLLGRLDFLVVIEAALPTSVRLRTIDVESGAVKAVGVCEAGAGWFGGSSVDYDECLSPFVTQTNSVANQRLTSKRLKVEQEAAAARVRQEEQAQAERRRLEEEEAAARARVEEQAATERRRQEAEEAAQQQRREQQIQRAVRQREIDPVRPDYERAMTRLRKEAGFWDEMVNMMAESGNSFRPEIQVALETANSKGENCTFYYNNLQTRELRGCVSELNHDVSILEALR